MSQIRLVAVDMDGTLLNDKKEKPADFIPWVKSHPGVVTVIASGRQYETLRLDFEEVQDELYFLADNGAFVFYRGEMLYANEMKKNTVRELLALIDTIPDTHVILCGAQSAYARHASPYEEENTVMYYKKLVYTDDLAACIDNDVFVKIAIFFKNKDAAKQIRKLADIDESVAPVLSGDSWIDILNDGVNKGSGIRAIQKEYGISKEESMAFGDYMNDYEMLLACGESYAMENAEERLKSAAKHIAPSNNEEGVMRVLAAQEEAMAKGAEADGKI